MGDSLAEAFGDYQLVSSSNLLATRGRRTDNIDQEIATAISLAPRTIFLSYGMNDLEYCRGNAQRFIRQYKKQIQEFNEALKQMCEEEQITYIDNTALMDWSPAVYEIDGVHPKYSYYPIWLAHMANEAGI